MKFIVESITTSTARLGTLHKSERCKLQTPLLLLYTKGATVPYLSKEMVNFMTTELQAIEINVDTTCHMVKSLAATKFGIAAFANLEGYITFVTIKNTAELSASAADVVNKLSINTKSGRKQFTSDEYMDLMELYRPDIFHPLCDGDTNIESSKKRVIKSAERTESFFETCFDRFKKSKTLQNSMFIASIEGGYNMIERKNNITKMLHPEISGYFLDGFHSNHNSASKLNMENMEEIVSNCIKLLPNDKMKVMLGAYNPVTMLELINLGIDICDSSYAYLATKQNYALNFNFKIEKTNETSFDIYLADVKYKEDFQPILADCSCFICKKYTRAYIHHLVNTKELLASILLMIHNTHHYLEFFKIIRQSISNNTFPELISLVRRQHKNKVYNDEKPNTVETSDDQ